MAATKERMQRLRAKRKGQGEQAMEVWFDRVSQDHLVRVRRPGESVSAVVRRALAVLAAQEATGQQRVTSDTPERNAPPVPRDAVEAALVGLVQALFPVDTPVYPRHSYGIASLPLYAINTLMHPHGLVLRAKKTRLSKHVVLCTDKDGRAERYGLFELRGLTGEKGGV
ncbi:MAG: hypothetical protein ACREOH_16910 [Candidatus Entotheonellia bacterium]